MLPRRVYRRELRTASGFGATWFGILQQRGKIPRGRRDHERGREWWSEDEAQAIVDALNAAAITATKAKSAQPEATA